ncbi:hypothetical protein BV242_06800 [Lactiplantibacillus plantarum]|nr:hypothetical protein BV224_08725 [Lactiplantibacillus plantarum]TAR07323.1 hypothetical protein BV228_08295 [Lactiplantibacillus plantarum]TAR16242.1 hypothetical protein BV216_08200 [Lactiplantibacillus plantarum]TAR34862.1 hypothetical protein BV234_06375 [Lactiplantibacillus plantarum]TAR39040.1 hypothetical protein BV220_08505 [Lactiplantibacillus plantarum]
MEADWTRVKKAHPLKFQRVRHHAETNLLATLGIFKHPWAAVKSQNTLGNRIDANIGFVFAPLQPAQTLAKIPKVKASSRF